MSDLDLFINYSISNLRLNFSMKILYLLMLQMPRIIEHPQPLTMPYSFEVLRIVGRLHEEVHLAPESGQQLHLVRHSKELDPRRSVTQRLRQANVQL